MIRNSFIFLDRIGIIMERKIWGQGIHTWDDFVNNDEIKGLSKKSKRFFERKIFEASRELYNFNSGYFLKNLPLSETWRLYDFFKEDAVFLDIETSGVERHDSVMVIGLFDGVDTKIMIRGINLDMSALGRELKRYKIIVTFNGASFDLPFLNKRYPGLIPDIPHIDLRHVCEKVGLTGGLKEIEKTLGIRRNKIIENFYGGDPFRLWRMYRASGDEDYLKLLVEYNEEDVINLKTIGDLAVENLKKQYLMNFFD